MINRKTVYEMFHGKCAYCGNDISFDSFHVDHILPKNKGGKDKRNVFPACPDCNIFKSSCNVEEFREKILNVRNKNINTRIMWAYLCHEPHNVEFYYERIGYGVLQDG